MREKQKETMFIFAFGTLLALLALLVGTSPQKIYAAEEYDIPGFFDYRNFPFYTNDYRMQSTATPATSTQKTQRNGDDQNNDSGLRKNLPGSKEAADQATSSSSAHESKDPELAPASTTSTSTESIPPTQSGILKPIASTTIGKTEPSSPTPTKKNNPVNISSSDIFTSDVFFPSRTYANQYAYNGFSPQTTKLLTLTALLFGASGLMLVVRRQVAHAPPRSLAPAWSEYPTGELLFQNK